MTTAQALTPTLDHVDHADAEADFSPITPCSGLNLIDCDNPAVRLGRRRCGWCGFISTWQANCGSCIGHLRELLAQGQVSCWKCDANVGLGDFEWRPL